MTSKNETTAQPDRHWRVYGYEIENNDVVAPTPGAAIYKVFKAAREAGYFQGRHGFHTFLSVCYPRAYEVVA